MSEKPRRWWHRLFGIHRDRESQPSAGDGAAAQDELQGQQSGAVELPPEPESALSETAEPTAEPKSPTTPAEEPEAPVPDESHRSADVVIECQVETDRHEDFDEWMAPLVATAVDAPGFLGCSLDCRRDEGSSWRLQFRFAAFEQRQEFLNGDAYRRAFEWVPDIFARSPTAQISETQNVGPSS